MSGKKIFNINAGNQPNSGIAVTVVGERGRKELPPGTKGGENLKPDRHYEHKQHAFDSYCKRSIKNEAMNAYTQLRKRSRREVSLSELPEDAMAQLAVYDRYSWEYEDEFLKAVIGHSQQAAETDRKLKEKELKALLARDEELDGLFERIYEDNVSGKLSDDRFAKMSRRYEDEQKELAEKIKKLRSEIEKQSSQAVTTDMFISLVRKYTRARKLTPRMLNELVEKIEVYNAEKIDGVWEQRLRIHYNCVGEITIPKMLPLPIPDVTVNTRKGVFVNYIPAEIAG